MLFRWLCVNACGCAVDLLILAKVKHISNRCPSDQVEQLYNIIFC